MKKIIIISGKMGSGKSSNAHRIMIESFSLDQCPRIFKFAETLYKLHDACLPVLKEAGLIPYDMVKEGNLLQILGTNYGRNHLGEDVWARACRIKVDKYLELLPLNTVIIDDCRFQNEIRMFPDAFKVRLECSRDLRKARCSYWREDENHPSETGLDDYKGFDLTVSTETTPLDIVSDFITKEWLKS